MTTHSEIVTLMASLDRDSYIDAVARQCFDTLQSRRVGEAFTQTTVDAIRREVLDMIRGYGREMEVASVRADPVHPDRVTITLAVPLNVVDIHFVL